MPKIYTNYRGFRDRLILLMYDALTRVCTRITLSSNYGHKKAILAAVEL